MRLPSTWSILTKCYHGGIAVFEILWTIKHHYFCFRVGVEILHSRLLLERFRYWSFVPGPEMTGVRDFRVLATTSYVNACRLRFTHLKCNMLDLEAVNWFVQRRIKQNSPGFKTGKGADGYRWYCVDSCLTIQRKRSWLIRSDNHGIYLTDPPWDSNADISLTFCRTNYVDVLNMSSYSVVL